ncbi:MAG: hypothetical protein GY788_13520 [bacterium]|nr:hypothetical protein [bacterium]
MADQRQAADGARWPALRVVGVVVAAAVFLVAAWMLAAGTSLVAGEVPGWADDIPENVERYNAGIGRPWVAGGAAGTVAAGLALAGAMFGSRGRRPGIWFVGSLATTLVAAVILTLAQIAHFDRADPTAGLAGALAAFTPPDGFVLVDEDELPFSTDPDYSGIPSNAVIRMWSRLGDAIDTCSATKAALEEWGATVERKEPFDQTEEIYPITNCAFRGTRGDYRVLAWVNGEDATQTGPPLESNLEIILSRP